MAEPLKIPYGLADITIGEGPDAIKFDGVEYLQADGGELSLEPQLNDINVADYGTGVYDHRIGGYEGSLTIVAAEEDIDVLAAALSYTEDITDTESGTRIGLMDAPIGTSLRKKAKKVTIHPRGLPDTSRDINIYKMAANGEFSRSYANEQGNVSITLAMYPRDGMKPDKPGNFFYIGGTDPNAGE